MSNRSVVAAARCHQGAALPAWFMRQAGRSLPEYRELRRDLPMLDACRTPEVVVEASLQPVRRHGVDAAIVYSDIMLPLAQAGIDLEIRAGVGPVIADPIRTAAQVRSLPELDPSSLAPIAVAVGAIRAALAPERALIGFAGAPFTLASYLVEGGPSRDYARTKALMAADPGLWDELCTRLAAMSATFLRVQVDAGADVVQVFDSWAGSLAAADYERQVLPHSASVLGSVRVPRIHFGVGTGELLALMGRAGAEVVGVDWRVPLDEAARRIGPGRAVQGNLDPALLGAPWPVIAERARAVIRAGAHAPGHIFNLGHGVPAGADPAVLTRLVELVHTEGPALRAEASATREEPHEGS